MYAYVEISESWAINKKNKNKNASKVHLPHKMIMVVDMLLLDQQERARSNGELLIVSPIKIQQIKP